MVEKIRAKDRKWRPEQAGEIMGTKWDGTGTKARKRRTSGGEKADVGGRSRQDQSSLRKN